MRSGGTLRSAFSVSVLALAVAGMGWADWRLLTMQVETPPPVRPPLAPADVAALSVRASRDPELPSLASFAVIAERPLFVAGRRYKPAAATEAPQPEADVAPEFHISGVMLHEGKARALISASGAPAEWVSEGQSVAGWTVRRIGAGATELVSESREITIELYKPAAGAP